MNYPIPIEQLIRAFAKLPSVGRRTSERFVFHLLKSGKKDVLELSEALRKLTKYIKSCETCWDFSDTSPCSICDHIQRDKQTICVVAEPQDMRAVERTSKYKGVYHILRGTLKPDQDPRTQPLKIRELLKRCMQDKPEEIILALNPDIRGETTMMLLEKKLKELTPDTKVTRLARGLPMGSDMQYADEITLGSALKYRRRQ